MSLLSNDQKILIDKALQLHKEGKLQEAIKSYSELLDKEKNNSQLLFLIGTAFVQIKDYNNGINYLKKSLSFKPNNASAYSNLGNAYKNFFNTKKH